VGLPLLLIVTHSSQLNDVQQCALPDPRCPVRLPPHETVNDLAGRSWEYPNLLDRAWAARLPAVASSPFRTD
jgi:hypothetical protein